MERRKKIECEIWEYGITCKPFYFTIRAPWQIEHSRSNHYENIHPVYLRRKELALTFWRR